MKNNNGIDLSGFVDAGKIPVDQLRDPDVPGTKTRVFIDRDESGKKDKPIRATVVKEDELGRMLSEEIGYIGDLYDEHKKSR